VVRARYSVRLCARVCLRRDGVQCSAVSVLAWVCVGAFRSPLLSSVARACRAGKVDEKITAVEGEIKAAQDKITALGKAPAEGDVKASDRWWSMMLALRQSEAALRQEKVLLLKEKAALRQEKVLLLKEKDRLQEKANLDAPSASPHPMLPNPLFHTCALCR